MFNDVFLKVLANKFAFFLAGFSVAVWAVMIPFVKTNFNLDEEQLGLLLLCLGCGSLIAMPFCSRIACALGIKRTIYICTYNLAAMLLVIALIDNLYLTIVSLIVIGASSITLEVSANINGGLLETRYNKHIMSALHAFYSIGSFCGALLCSSLLSIGFNLQVSVIVCVVTLLICLLLLCKELLTHFKNETDNSVKTHIHIAVVFIGTLCFIMFLVEGSMLDWSAVFLHQEKNVDLDNAGYGFVAFNSCMIIGRLTGDSIVKALGRALVLLVGSLIIFIGFVIMYIGDNYILCLIGFAIVGLGASNIVPQLISYAASKPYMPINQTMSLVNSIGYLGILSGPAIIGFISQRISVGNTFILLSIFVVFVGFASFILMRKKHD